MGADGRMEAMAAMLTFGELLCASVRYQNLMLSSDRCRTIFIPLPSTTIIMARMWYFYLSHLHGDNLTHLTFQYDQHNRPGGNVSTIPILSQDDTLQKQTYHLIGDRSSVLDVYLALRDSNCSIQDTESDLAVYNVDDASHVVQPEQVVQWYRASSFALSMDSYNNSASSLALMPQNNDTAALPSSADSPYPADTDLDFLGCLNITIGQSVPLIDYTNNNSDTGLAFGIFIGIISGVLLCLCLGMWCHRRRRARRTRKTVEDGQQAGVVVKGEKTEAKAITLDGTKEYKTIDDSKSVPAEDIQDVMQRPEPSVLPTSEPIPKRQSQSTPK